MKRCIQLSLVLTALCVSVFAARAYALEAQYPSLPQFGVLTQNTNTLPQVFLFLFTLALWAAGIILFGNIVYTGFQYMTSAGDPGKQKEARRRFGGVVLGAAMLLGTFLILQIVNPELTSLKNLTFGICNADPNSPTKNPNLPDCPQVTFPTIGGTTGIPTLPPPVPMPQANGFVYYCQMASTWCGTSYGASTIGYAGCSATSFAMILSTLGSSCNGQVCTPPVVADMISQGQINGLSMTAGGLSIPNWSSLNGWLSGEGLIVDPSDLADGNGNLDVARAQKFLSQNQGTITTLIIGSSHNFPCANCTDPNARIDHLFVVDAIDTTDPSNPIVEIRDPNSCAGFYNPPSCNGWGGSNYNNEGSGPYAPQPGQPTRLPADDFTWLYAHVIAKR